MNSGVQNDDKRLLNEKIQLQVSEVMFHDTQFERYCITNYNN